MSERPFGPLPERQAHEWVYLEPGKGWGPKSLAYFRCMRCHIKRLRKVDSADRATDVCHDVPYVDRNRFAAKERQRRLREAKLCTVCGVAPAAGGERCKECRVRPRSERGPERRET